MSKKDNTPAPVHITAFNADGLPMSLYAVGIASMVVTMDFMARAGHNQNFQINITRWCETHHAPVCPCSKTTEESHDNTGGNDPKGTDGLDSSQA